MKIIKTAAYEQHMLFNPADYPAKPMKPVVEMPPEPEYSGDIFEDLEYSGETPEGVLKHYKIPHEKVSFVDGTTVITANIQDTQYVIQEDGRHSEASEWLYGLNDWDVENMMPSRNFNEDFWNDPPHELYHGTDPEFVDNILKEGLEARCETRGIGNRGMGCAVFTSPSVEMTQSYGNQKGQSATIVIHVDKMKAAGYMPEVSQEEGFDRKESLEAIAHKIGLEEFYHEMSDNSLAEDTVAFYDSIPPQFLSLYKPDPRGLKGLDYH